MFAEETMNDSSQYTCPSNSRHTFVPDCTNYGVGKYNSEAGEACSVCSAGKYNGGTGSSACSDCSTSIESCVDWEAGKFATEQASASCSICSSGKYYSSSTTPCINCAAGKYIMDDGTDVALHMSINSCFDCDAGKTSTSPASSCPITCPTGTYAAGTPCLDCEAGKFNKNSQQVREVEVLNSRQTFT